MRSFSGELLKRLELAIRRSPVTRRLLIGIGALAVTAPVIGCDEQINNQSGDTRPDISSGNVPGLSANLRKATKNNSPAASKIVGQEKNKKPSRSEIELKSGGKFNITRYVNPRSPLAGEATNLTEGIDEVEIIEDTDIPPYSTLSLDHTTSREKLEEIGKNTSSYPILGQDANIDGLQIMCEANTRSTDQSAGTVNFFDQKGTPGLFFCIIPGSASQEGQLNLVG